MSFRIKAKSCIIEIDTKQELREALDVLGILNGREDRAESEGEYEEEEDDAGEVSPHPSPQGATAEREGEDREEQEIRGQNEQEERKQEGEETEEERRDRFQLCLKVFFRLIADTKQEKLVHHLRQAFPKGYGDDNLRKLLDLHDNRILGALLTAITKNARKCRLPAVIDRIRCHDGKSKYIYLLTGEFHAVLRLCGLDK